MQSTSPGQPISVLTVDDHVFLREGISAVLSRNAEFRVVGEAADGAEAIEQFRLLRPDVTLMDLQMEGMNGIDAMIAIRREFPDARFVALTTYQGDVQALRALQAGALGYLLKNSMRKELFVAIRAAHSGTRYLSPEIANELAMNVGIEGLTSREVRVLQTVAQGHSNKSVASVLDVSEETVKAHMKAIMSKLYANDRTHAVAIALKRGIISL